MLLAARVLPPLERAGLWPILPLRERAGLGRRCPDRASRKQRDRGGRRRQMGLFDRLRGSGSGGRRRGTLDRGSHRGDLAHLEQFVATRRGVEGYVEPRTAVTETTIVLVAADGEWTRRRIDGPDVARRLSPDLASPV